MTYELAKQLKDARFPQYGEGKIYPVLNAKNDGDPMYHYDKELTVYIPTLSELIEACGDRFWSLDRTPFSVKGAFEAKGHWSDDRFIEYGYGSTPEEAVARLWLELNEK